MGRLAELRGQKQRLREAQGNVTYNYPNQWYMRHDKEIVSLPASPRDRVKYESKGFLWLDPDAVEEWLGDPAKGIVSERLIVIGDQRKKAKFIEQIRLIEEMHPKAKISARLGRLNLVQLEMVIKTLSDKYGDIVDMWDEAALGLPEIEGDDLHDEARRLLEDLEAGDPMQLAARIAKSRANDRRPLMGGEIAGAL